MRTDRMLKKIVKSYDFTLILVIVLISLFGLVMIYSSSMVVATTKYQVASDYFYDKQKINLLLALFVFGFFAVFPYKIFKHRYVIISIFALSILVLALLGLVGRNVNNAQSWIALGGLNIQPAEFIKMGMIIYLSAVYSKKQSYIDDFNHAILPPIFFLLFICFLICLQPDIGTALIIFLIGATVILSSGISFKSVAKLFGRLLLGLALLAPLFFLFRDKILTETRMGRLYSYLNPFDYEKNEGYQLVNSYLAIGNGGITGQGLGQSVMKYGYLPEPHTDFIMAVIAEELGIIGVLFVLLCLGFIVLKGYKIAARCQDPFGSLLAIGISSMIGIQTFINLGGLTGLIPITGVTLPFVSYGGSSILLLAISMGILVNVSMFITYEKRYKTGNQQTVPKEFAGLQNNRFSLK